MKRTGIFDDVGGKKQKTIDLTETDPIDLIKTGSTSNFTFVSSVVGATIFAFLEIEDLKRLWLSSKEMLKEVGDYRLVQHQKQSLAVMLTGTDRQLSLEKHHIGRLIYPSQPRYLCRHQHRCLFGVLSFLRSYFNNGVVLTLHNLQWIFNHNDDHEYENRENRLCEFEFLLRQLKN